jgi:hypothetical protein
MMGYIETREEYAGYVHELFDLLRAGKLKIKIHKVYPLADIQQAHRVSLSLSSLARYWSRLTGCVGSGGPKNHRQAPAETMKGGYKSANYAHLKMQSM